VAHSLDAVCRLFPLCRRPADDWGRIRAARLVEPVARRQVLFRPTVTNHMVMEDPISVETVQRTFVFVPKGGFGIIQQPLAQRPDV
jgi:hypothetical protein